MVWEKHSFFPHLADRQLGRTSKFRLFDVAKSNKALVQKLALQRKLLVHKGCVNSICWSDDGRYILSGSDDQHLCITDINSYEIVHDIQTAHRANIFCAKFLPNTNNRHIISCSGDGNIIFSDVEEPDTSLYNVFTCHYGTAYELCTVPKDSNTFLSCGEDGTVRWFDLRTKTHCAESDCKEDILISCRYAVTALACNPFAPYLLAVGCADSYVRIFDRRMLGTRALGNFNSTSVQSVVNRFTVPDFDEGKHHRITSLCYSPDAREMLVSYSSDYIYLFDTEDKSAEPRLFKTELSKGSKKSQPEKCSVRRLRLRGDWSDTGPNARPAHETEPGSAGPGAIEITSSGPHRDPIELSGAEERRPSAQNRPNLMQRMSDVLTRIFNTSSTPPSPRGPGQRGSYHSSQLSTSTDSGISSATDGSAAPRLNCPQANHGLCCVPQAAVSESNSKADLSATADGPNSEDPLASQQPESSESVEVPTTLVVASMGPTGGARSSSAAAELTPILKKEKDCDTVGRGRDGKSHHVQLVDEGIAKELDGETRHQSYTPSCSSLGSGLELEDSDRSDSGHDEDDSSSRFSDSSSDKPGNKTFTKSLEHLEKELTQRREQLMARSSKEPVVNLQYSGQGVNSGLITVESGSIGSPGSPSSSYSGSGFLTVERPASVMSDSLLVPCGSNSISPGLSPMPTSDGIRLALSDTDMAATAAEAAKESGSLMLEVDTVPVGGASNDISNWPCDMSNSVTTEATLDNDSNLETNTDDDLVLEEEDGRRSRRGRRSDELSTDEDDCLSPEPPKTPANESNEGSEQATASGSASRNPRDILLRSFDDVIKHFREEKEQEKAQIALGMPRIKQTFTGHRNARTMIKEATFWGNDYIMSGSDCGHIFIWDRHSAELVMLLEADHHVVNCLQPHPFDPILASSGIDYDIKLFAPIRLEPCFDEHKAGEIIRRNEIMLEETKDTITVPASFMIRMLTSLNHLRSHRRGSRSRAENRTEESDTESS